MQFNKTSWHYQLLTKGEFKTDSFANKVEWGPVSLCPYVRTLLKQLLVSIIVYGILVCVVAAMIHSPILLTTWWIYGIQWIAPPMESLYALGVIIYSAILIVFGYMGVTFSIKWLRTKLPKQKAVVQTRKEPNLFMEYAKAIHKKVCPIITFK